MSKVEQHFDPDPAEYEAEFDERAEVVAEGHNCVVLLPEDEYTLQLDIDSNDDYILLTDQLRRMEVYGGTYTRLPLFRIVATLPSRNGNRHVILRSSKKLSIEERCLWQALLGSDRVREMLNLLRYDKGVENPIRLFRPKEEQNG